MFRERLKIRLDRAVRHWQAALHLLRTDSRPMPEWKPMFSFSPISSVRYVQGNELREAAPFFDPARFY